MTTSQSFAYQKPALASRLVLHRRCWRLLRCRKSAPISQAGQIPNKSHKHQITPIGCHVLNDPMQLAAPSSIHHAVERG
jgi:hypothetical protein